MLSDPKPVTGGAVQGSVLGVLDHNVVLDDLNEDLAGDLYVAKNVDNITVVNKVGPCGR